MARDSKATVLGVASMSRTLPVVGAALVALFVFMKPEATAGYGLVGRLMFWTVHIGLGLGSIVIASLLLRPGLLRAMPLPAALLLTGLAGAALLAPVYALLELVTPEHLAETPDDWLDAFAASGPVQFVIAEFLEVAPMFLAAWFAVNLPLMLMRPEMNDSPPSAPKDPDGGPGDRQAGTPQVRSSDRREQFFAQIPLALGRDIIALSSDMHYLHVHTVLGKCMVLGTLRDAADLFEDIGMLVHRSHWVAHAHVKRIARSGSSWECLMSNDLRIPVSRRNHTKVTGWYGSAARVVSIGSRKVG